MNKLKQFKFINDAFLPLIKKKCPILIKLNLNKSNKMKPRDEEEKKRKEK